MNFLPYKTEHIIEQLIEEFEDAISFMETFEDAPEEWMGDEGYDRLERKKELLALVMRCRKDGNEEDGIPEDYENQTVTEWCPYCDHEVELKQKFERQTCPNCRKEILPCAQCETQNCKDCPLDEKVFTLYYEIAKPMTIDIEASSIEKAISEFHKMDSKALEEQGEGNDSEIILDNFYLINGVTEVAGE